MADINNQGFGWDDEIEESSFEVLPDGDYRFEVTGFERGWWEPQRSDSKIPACNQAEIEMTINWVNKDGQTRTNKLTYKLKLVRNLQFLIYQFFEAVGLRKKGDHFPVQDAGGFRRGRQTHDQDIGPGKD